MVKAKKHLGQHFLLDENVAFNIVKALTDLNVTNAIEIGPGTGVLTKYLLKASIANFKVNEIDEESVEYLLTNYPELQGHILTNSFLDVELGSYFSDQVSVIGNFPYNISSQIIFNILDQYKQIPYVVGMFQKEVAERICAKEGSKKFGVISVFTQLFYHAQYLFTVPATAFDPPPKVQSGVLILKRKTTDFNLCDYAKLKQVVKTTFGMRRKMMRNSLKGFANFSEVPSKYLTVRPEELSVDSFIELTNLLFPSQKK